MEGECRGNLGRLLSRRALRGVTGQRGALRSRAVDGDEITLCQQPRAKLHVIFEVEGPVGFELHAEVGDVEGFGQVLHASDAAELLLGVLRDG